MPCGSPDEPQPHNRSPLGNRRDLDGASESRGPRLGTCLPIVALSMPHQHEQISRSNGAQHPEPVKSDYGLGRIGSYREFAVRLTFCFGTGLNWYGWTDLSPPIIPSNLPLLFRNPSSGVSRRSRRPSSRSSWLSFHIALWNTYKWHIVRACLQWITSHPVVGQSPPCLRLVRSGHLNSSRPDRRDSS